jgi:hypothetical protein
VTTVTKIPELGHSIHIGLSSGNNQIKLKTIMKTSQELLGLNIHSALELGEDALGKFYEIFLKYGNGAKKIGIVLTARHITRTVVEASTIPGNDMSITVNEIRPAYFAARAGR